MVIETLNPDQSFVTNLAIEYFLTVNLLMSVKGTLSPNKNFSYMKDITSLNIIHKVKISFEPPFSSKIADLAEIVRLEGPEKQAIVSCSWPEKQAISLL